MTQKWFNYSIFVSLKRNTMRLLFFIASFLGSMIVNAQCNETDEVKVILIGDSWAFFMGVDGTFNNVFEDWGHSNIRFFTNPTLAENGAEAIDFMRADKRNEIVAQLNAHPNVEVVHVSLGGNDYMGDWDVSFTQAQSDELLDTITNRLISIFDFIKSAKPGVKIVWSGYTYPNFGEVIASAAPFQTSHPFYGTWQGMGQPDFSQINAALQDVADRMDTYVASTNDVYFVNCPGILQFTFGQTQPLGVAPGGTYPPFSVPLPYGDPNYPSPKNSMRDYFITKDCFHLSPRGYEDFIGYQTQKFYHKFFMDDAYLLSRGGVYDGNVSSQGNTANMLELGVDGDTKSTLLSFNTSSLPDTNIVAASIFIRKNSSTGANTLGSTMQVRVKSGYFGVSSHLEAIDFNDLGNAADMACRFGSTGNNQWIRLDLPVTLLPFIGTDTMTQFIISTNSSANGTAVFYDSADPDFAPVLNLKFGSSPVGVSQSEIAPNVNVFPNPTNGNLFVDFEGDIPDEIMVFNVLGESALRFENQNEISLYGLEQGMYWLKIGWGDTFVWKKVLKIN